MYSGNNSKHIALAVLLFVLCVSAASAQQIPMDMIENMIHPLGFFSLVPNNEFHRAFQNFVRERYRGRSWLYEMEVQNFTASFVIYASSGSTGEAWKKYRDAAAEQQAKAEAEREKREAAEKVKRDAEAAAAAKMAKMTHRLTTDVQLFAAQDFGAAVTANLKKGTLVQVHQYGDYTDFDDETAKWAQVTTEDDKSGWIFSGFLENKPR